MDRADIVHEAFLARVSAGEFPSGDAPYGPLSGFEAVAIFRAQCLSRNIVLLWGNVQFQVAHIFNLTIS